MEGTKTCTICGRELPVDMFGLAKRESDGRRYECNDCRRKEREGNKERTKEYKKEYYRQNKDNIAEKCRNRRETDEVYRIAKDTSLRLRRCFNRDGDVDALFITRTVGLPPKDFVSYLNHTFVERYGYMYENKKDVEIDHIIPISTAKTIEDVKRLNTYTNLQLLTCIDNSIKFTRTEVPAL